MLDDLPEVSRVNFGELSRLYELLEEFGSTLVEPTNRPLKVIIFETFHRWEVKEVIEREQFHLADDLQYIADTSRWVWLETGVEVNFTDDDGQPRDAFGLHGVADREEDFFAGRKVVLVPDYVQSLDAALHLKGQLSFLNLQLTELETEFFTRWKAQLFAGDRLIEDSAAIPSVALLKVVVRQLLSRPAELNWPKFGPGRESYAARKSDLDNVA
jgi:hypothetical protein